jgi:hypothetical protein
VRNVKFVLSLILASALLLAAAPGVFAVTANDGPTLPDASRADELMPYEQLDAPDAGTYLEEFPDANFRQAVLDLLNEDGANRTAGSIVTANDLLILASVTYLYVGYMDICDMTGLALFSGLRSLNCWENQLYR